MQAMKNNQYSSYDATPHDGTPREIEAWALLKSAAALEEARRNPADQEGMRTALRANLVLWTIFQAAVMEDDCELPEDVRKNVFGLAAHVDKFTFHRFADMDASRLDFLIDMNRNIAAGLSAEVVEAAGVETTPLDPTPRPATVRSVPAPSQVSDEDVREALSLLGDLKA